MKLTLLLFLTITLFLGVNAQTKKRDSFEGTITYKIKFTPKSNNSKYNDYQKQKYGEEVKVFISKNGNFKREYITSGEKGFAFFSYDISTNKCYTKWRNIDTTYALSCSTNSLTLISEKDLPTETINGQICEGYFIAGVDSKGDQHVSLSYYYPNGKEFIDPVLYKNYKDFFYNKFIEKSKAPFYKLVMDMGYYVVTFEIDKIEQVNLDPITFNLPIGIPIIE